MRGGTRPLPPGVFKKNAPPPPIARVFKIPPKVKILEENLVLHAFCQAPTWLANCFFVTPF